jgi:hypothetical protein
MSSKFTVICLLAWRTAASRMTMRQVATDLNSTVTLNDGVVMPLFGLGCYRAEVGSPTEDAVIFALQHGYRMIDTAQFYGSEFTAVSYKQ